MHRIFRFRISIESEIQARYSSGSSGKSRLWIVTAVSFYLPVHRNRIIEIATEPGAKTLFYPACEALHVDTPDPQWGVVKHPARDSGYVDRSLCLALLMSLEITSSSRSRF